ncbi:hypothetical protein ABPG77_002603 [Micractinium sp. CCAP 211/92]
MQAEFAVSFNGQPFKNGELIAPEDALATPEASIGGDAGLYTIVSTDPDPPDPANPVKKEWMHWIVTNIPAGGSASQGQEVAKWREPSPPIGTHRYVFLLFRQPSQEPAQIEDPFGGSPIRAHFNTREFAAKHALGDPVAVAWFNSRKS